ncbi:hypothetical protein D9M68_971850 [compost metagenome]
MAVRFEGVVGVSCRADRVAHVVQAVEERHQVQALFAVADRVGHLEARIAHAACLRAFVGGAD